jgi:decaprenylphospho-beta-D-ribofuranose 2-oxidase
MLEALVEHRDSTYSVAWIDCVTGGNGMGRGLLTLGEHSEEGPLRVGKARPGNIPFVFPDKLLNRFSVAVFNELYYRKGRDSSTKLVDLESFFYPLDSLSNWNRLYGKAGFLQYQLVLPLQAGPRGLKEILARVASSGQGSFLAVLKTFGKQNANYLSFPIEGFTLALDFKVCTAAFALLDSLDRIVLDHGGRLYLAKDARMTEAVFKASYPNWELFEKVRAEYHAVGKFSSFLSRRIGLT